MIEPVVSAPASSPSAGFARGAAWSAINAFGGVALPFIVFMAFARWVSPEQIGVAVLATSIAEIMKSFGAPGLYEALLQQGLGAHRHHQTVLAVLLVLGTVLTLVFAGLITAVGWVLPSVREEGWLLDVVGLRILFDLATVQPQAALAQRLNFGRMAVRSIVANACAGLLGGVIGLLGYPLEGLIIFLVSQSALIFAMTAIGTAALVCPVLYCDCVADMRGEAFAASVVRLVAALNNYLDQILVANMLGSARLAFFNLGKRVETTFITAASSFSTIMFQPLFSLALNSTQAAGLRNSLAMLTMTCGVPAAFIATNSAGVIHLVFGERWAEASPVVALLACSGFARSLGSVHGALLSVSRRNQKLMWITSVSAISGIALVFAASAFGIVAIATALTLKNTAMLLSMALLTRSDFAHSGRAYVTVVLLPFAAMLAAGCGMHAVAIALVGNLQAGHAPALLLTGFAVALAGLAALAPSLQLQPALRARLPFRRPATTTWSIAP